MKICPYCGRDNEDAAASCAECRTTFSSATESLDVSDSRTTFAEIVSDPVRLFRALVVVSTGAYILWWVHPLLATGMVSDDMRDVLSWHGYGALVTLPPTVKWLVFFLYLALAIGLWTFSRSARLLFMMFTGFFVVLTLFSGVQVSTGFSGFLGYLISLADGAIIVMAYTEPLRGKFE